MTQFMNKKRLALAHIYKAKKGMTEETYRDVLSSVGAESAKELTPHSYFLFLKRVKALPDAPR